jgi:F0F1-type ATP synthase membrane subunit b/b'
MIEEHLKAIAAKEKEAKEHVRGAEAMAQEIIEKARRDGEKRIEQVKMDAAEFERALKAEAAEKAKIAIERLRADNRDRLASLGVIADKNQNEALDLIVEVFRGGL